MSDPADDARRPSLVVGTMNFGKRTSRAESERIVARALELGLREFDTANVYNDGESERILGAALAGRSDVRVATKVGLARAGRHPEGLSRAAIRSAIDASLERLGRDHVELYYLHAPDPRTPIEESLEAVGELVREGKVLSLGLSNYASWQILEAMTLARERGTPRPEVSQVIYNLLVRQLEVEYAAFTRRYPVHTSVYNPLAGGLLTERHALGAPAEAGSRFDGNTMYQRRYWSARLFELRDAYADLARGIGLDLVELAYAWVAGAPFVDSILIGPASVAHLEAAVAAVARELPAEARARIDELHRAFTGTDAAYARLPPADRPARR